MEENEEKSYDLTNNNGSGIKRWKSYGYRREGKGTGWDTFGQ